MGLRTRLLLAFAAIVLVPIALLAVGLRQEMARRLSLHPNTLRPHLRRLEEAGLVSREVRKTATGFAASVGKETFDVTLNVNISNGKILSARMENPVTKVARACSDGALTQCGDAQATPTLRRIELSLLRE